MLSELNFYYYMGDFINVKHVTTASFDQATNVNIAKNVRTVDF